jgi:eukaryotic-like serine/threonine-protein kinase
MAKYRFGELIGGGGFGEIYEAICVDDNWKGVAKKLRPPFEAEDRARFQREVRLMTTLEHPNIVGVRASKMASETPWYAMERGVMNLSELVAETPDDSTLMSLFLEVCRGLDYAHRQGIIHRDIKPQNVIIFEDLFGEHYAALSDFGLGKRVDSTSTNLTATDTRLGTESYMSPEQLDDSRSVDVRADVFSLGKLLYFIITKRSPMHVNSDLVPGAFRHVIARATAVRPDDRYSSAAEVAAAVEKARSREILPSVDAFNTALESFRAEKTDEALRELSVLIEGLRVDDSFMLKVFARTPAEVLYGLLRLAPGQTRAAITDYDRLVTGSMAFDYCDIVANFYALIHQCSPDAELRLLVLRRLASVGQEHNRFFVGETFGRLLAAETDESVLFGLAEYLNSHEAVGRWLRAYVASPPPILRRALADSDSQVRR